MGRNGLCGDAAIAALENVGSAVNSSTGRSPGEDRPLYPPADTQAAGMLDVGAPHRIYWETSGNPKGVPIIFLHGGPGAGTAPAYRRFFDPVHYKIILFDQRGAGKSLPEAELHDNTTAHLIADIEALRRHLRVDRWIVFGGSWGSTLALAYGQAYPDHCIGFILRGVFLFTADEVDWFVRGMGRFFPEAYRAFAGLIPVAERGELLQAYYTRLTSADPAIHKPAATAWCAYENACSRLIPGIAKDGRNEGSEGESYYTGALAMARIEAHYMVHGGFLRPGQLLEGMHVLARHPAVIVQGRYDMVCPIATADAVARAWPGTHYRIVPDAGHSSMEPGIRSALVKATEDFKIYR